MEITPITFRKSINERLPSVVISPSAFAQNYRFFVGTAMGMLLMMEVKKSLVINASAQQVFALLLQIPAQLKLLPKLEKIEPLGNQSFRLSFAPLSAAGHSATTIFATQFATNRTDKIRWEPIEDEASNAKVSGLLSVKSTGPNSCEITIEHNEDVKLSIPELLKRMTETAFKKDLDDRFDGYLTAIKTYAERTKQSTPA